MIIIIMTTTKVAAATATTIIKLILAPYFLRVKFKVSETVCDLSQGLLFAILFSASSSQ